MLSSCLSSVSGLTYSSSLYIAFLVFLFCELPGRIRGRHKLIRSELSRALLLRLLRPRLRALICVHNSDPNNRFFLRACLVSAAPPHLADCSSMSTSRTSKSVKLPMSASPRSPPQALPHPMTTAMRKTPFLCLTRRSLSSGRADRVVR